VQSGERNKMVPRMPGKTRPANLKHNSILIVTIALLICTIAAPTTARAHKLVGAWEQIPNVNTTEVQEIAGWAVAEHARHANDGLRLKRVMSGVEQIVSGANWKLRLEAVNGDGVGCVYTTEVYDEPWTNTRTLDYFTPAQSTQDDRCNHPRPPNSRSARVRPRFCFLGFLITASLVFFLFQFQ
jgi:hypothetical protein